MKNKTNFLIDWLLFVALESPKDVGGWGLILLLGRLGNLTF
jgi:hypothetical protein